MPNLKFLSLTMHPLDEGHTYTNNRVKTEVTYILFSLHIIVGVRRTVSNIFIEMFIFGLNRKIKQVVDV